MKLESLKFSVISISLLTGCMDTGSTGMRPTANGTVQPIAVQSVVPEPSAASSPQTGAAVASPSTIPSSTPSSVGTLVEVDRYASNLVLMDQTSTILNSQTSCPNDSDGSNGTVDTRSQPNWLFGGESSVVCGPVAGAMALALLGRTTNNTIGWMKSKFVGRTWPCQVKALGFLMGTATDGTRLISGSSSAGLGAGVAGRAADLVGNPYGYTTTLQVLGDTFNPGQSFMTTLSNGYIHVVVVGQYNVVAITTLGRTDITFARQSGHMVTVRGYVQNPYSNVVLAKYSSSFAPNSIYYILQDPYKGLVNYLPIRVASLGGASPTGTGGLISTLPNGLASEGYIAGYYPTSVGFIESFTSLTPTR